jgi:dTMP kinase
VPSGYARPISRYDDGAGHGADATRQLVTGRAPLHAYRALLRNHNYRLWFASSLGSSLGDWIGLFALQVLVISLAEPGSRIALFGLGGIMMARLLPSVLFGPVAGVLADRYDRKRLMVGADIARGVLYLGIVFSTDLIALFTLAFLIECLSLLYITSQKAVLPGIVEPHRLTSANQLGLFVTYGPLPFGAAVSTLMVAVAALARDMGLPAVDPTRLALVLTAFGFWASGAVISRMQRATRGRAADTGERPSAVEELRNGLAFIRDLPLIRALIVGLVGVFFGAGVIVTLGPEFVRTSLERSETDWYTLMSAVGGGLLGGILLVPVVTARFREERLFPVFLTATAAIATAIATFDDFGLTLVAGLFLGACAGLSVVLGYTLLLRHTTDKVRGKTFGAFFTSTRIAMFAALGLAPFVAGTIGRFTIGAFGAFITVSGVRITILVGGLVALYSAVRVWRGVYRALAKDQSGNQTGVRLNGGDATPAPGTFVAFEGVEGSGKSTQVERLAQTLRSEGREVLVTREPGGPAVAERIREVLLDPEVTDMHPRTEALLYAAARAEHVQQVIIPALAAGKVVVCDRFLDSSLAYQGHARNLGPDDVFEINRWAIAGVLPDVVVLLQLQPEEGLRRVTAQRDTDRIEGEDAAFHQRVADGFRRLAERDPDRFIVVKADGDPDTIAKEIRERLQGRVL